MRPSGFYVGESDDYICGANFRYAKFHNTILRELNLMRSKFRNIYMYVYGPFYR